jgi:hypothetical protein
MVAILAIIFILLLPIGSGADIYKYVSEDGAVVFTNTPFSDRGMVVVREGQRQYKKDEAKTYAKTYAKGSAFHAIAEEKSRQHNMDPALVKAVIKAESNWNHTAVSPKGARGLMQLMPSTASILGVSNSFDPEENIDGGIRYLKYLLNKFNGNLSLALAAYNAGPKLVEKRKAIPMIPETVAYVKRVINYYSKSDFGGHRNAAVNTAEFTVREKSGKIQKIALKDGTILFTNSSLAGSH